MLKFLTLSNPPQQAEHSREVALRDEIMRLERLERMAEKFDKKAGMRAGWLLENQKLVSQVCSGDGHCCCPSFILLNFIAQLQIFKRFIELNAL